jgi:4-hydroxy-3-polyprenylbenzoate decarboxylase
VTPTPLQRWIIGVTGASGAPYAHRLIGCALDANVQVHLVVTPYGRRLFRDEMGLQHVTTQTLLGRDDDRLIVYNYREIGAAIASGSTPMDGMIVCPCSSNSLAQIAAGMGDNLLNRAAQVTLKERRRLIVVPREMPMSHIEIENCLRLSTAGAIICPASPGFYMLPKRVEDLVDFVVGKILDLAGIRHTLNTRWTDVLTHEPEAEDAP